MAIDYLRLSLTDRCNLNCIYCTPLEKNGFLPRAELLTHEEMAKAAAAFVLAGVKKIRLTGGEPLLRRGVTDLAAMIRAIPGLKELALTTNGLLLEQLAEPLRGAGVDRLNISLDSLKKDTFSRITGHDGFDRVWRGVEKSLSAGFAGVKLNVIIMRGVNDAEIADFAALSVKLPLSVRFIEFFNTNTRSGRLAGALVPTAEVRGVIESAHGPLSAAARAEGDGPASRWKLPGAAGEIGFISGSTSNFCGACNRVRMDCTGRVYPCLFSAPSCSLRDALRSGAGEAGLAGLIKNVFLVKYQYNKNCSSSGHIEMSSIGG